MGRKIILYRGFSTVYVMMYMIGDPVPGNLPATNMAMSIGLLKNQDFLLCGRGDSFGFLAFFGSKSVVAQFTQMQGKF